LIIAVLMAVGCVLGNEPNTPGTGGSRGTGGSIVVGGSLVTGGIASTGGIVVSGGATSAGGSTAVVSTGGVIGSGGASTSPLPGTGGSVGGSTTSGGGSTGTSNTGVDAADSGVSDALLNYATVRVTNNGYITGDLGFSYAIDWLVFTQNSTGNEIDAHVNIPVGTTVNVQVMIPADDTYNVEFTEVDVGNKAFASAAFPMKLGGTYDMIVNSYSVTFSIASGLTGGVGGNVGTGGSTGSGGTGGTTVVSTVDASAGTGGSTVVIGTGGGMDAGGIDGTVDAPNTGGIIGNGGSTGSADAGVVTFSVTNNSANQICHMQLVGNSNGVVYTQLCSIPPGTTISVSVTVPISTTYDVVPINCYGDPRFYFDFWNAVSLTLGATYHMTVNTGSATLDSVANSGCAPDGCL
jgi:hypothetical protein